MTLFHNHRRFPLWRRVFYLAVAGKKKVSFVFIALKTISLGNLPRRDSREGCECCITSSVGFSIHRACRVFLLTIDWFSSAILPKYGKSYYAIFKTPNQQEWPWAIYSAGGNMCFTSYFKIFALISLS